MADIKWIHITTDLFDDEKIQIIESMPDHDALILLWIKLLCLAGKVNRQGTIVLTDDIPYTEEHLALVLRRPLNTVRLALKTFTQLHMLELWGDGTIYLPNWEKYQNIEGMERIREGARLRQRKHRLSLVGGDAILERDNYLCVYCGASASGIDHVQPVSRGGSEDRENKVASCARCNQKKMLLCVRDFLNNVLREGIFPINIDGVVSHPILGKHVQFDRINHLFKDVTVTHCDGHGVGGGGEEEKDKNKNRREEEIIWQTVLTKIKEKVSPINFKTWFEPTIGLGSSDGIYLVGVSRPDIAEYIENNQRQFVEGILMEVLQKPVHVDFQQVKI